MKRYKVCDKTLPRYRVSKHRYNVLNRELFERFEAENPELVDWDTFKLINEKVNEELVKIAIENREGVKLPGQIGRINLSVFKIKKHFIDRKLDKDPDQIAFHTVHTNGLQGKVCWNMDHIAYQVKNHNYYGFRPYRGFCEAASRAFRETPERYLRAYLTGIKDQKDKNKQLFKDEQSANKLNSKTSDQPSQDPQ